MIQATAFGKRIKKKLVDKNQNLTWLASQVHEATGLYCDTSLMHKVITGANNNEKIIGAIKQILEMK